MQPSHDKKTTRCGYSDYITLPVGKEKYSLKQAGGRRTKLVAEFD